ncbi:MAG: hypothetical protein FJW86_08400 [Actinobacteria bacterium]|nr:hypothetical protein [Actinomycetota bacterium]
MRKVVIGAFIVAASALLLAPAGASNTAGSAGAEDGVRIVNFNILHGVFCEPESDFCQAADRVELFGQQLEESGCPEVVGLQEIRSEMSEALDELIKDICDGAYQNVFKDVDNGVDAERLLTTLKVKSEKVIELAGGFRTASRVVLKSAIGPLVVTTTHQDGDPDEPSAGCAICQPPRFKGCSPDRGIFECQADATIAFTEEVGGTKAVRVIMGDFNVDATTERYGSHIEAGYVDSHLEAGNAECVEATGVNCTSGRADDTIVALKDPAATESHRIDMIFVKSSAKCDVVFDSDADEDGDGIGTGLFFDEPTVDGPGGIVWVSDHTAVSADLSCG